MRIATFNPDIRPGFLTMDAGRSGGSPCHRSPAVIEPKLSPRTCSTAVRFRLSGRALRRWTRPSPPPACHPGLVPGSRPAPDRSPGPAPDRSPGPAPVSARGTHLRAAALADRPTAAALAMPFWTPEQVRGDGRGNRATPGTTTGDAGEPQSGPRVDRSVDNPLVSKPCTRSAKVKPDSSGTSPG